MLRVGRTNWRVKATIKLVSAKETNRHFVLVEEMIQVIAMHYIWKNHVADAMLPRTPLFSTIFPEAVNMRLMETQAKEELFFG
jgi:hypothetical protein